MRTEPLTSAIVKGVRAAVATLVPFFLASKLHHPELAWMALGGWLGTLADPGGVRSTRAKALASFIVLGALLVPLSELSARSDVAATAVLVAVAFTCTLARVLGPAAATIGTMLAIVTAVGTGRAGAPAYVADALAFAAGATWATLLSSTVWPLSVHRPVRRAVAAVFGAMSDHAQAVEACVEEADGSKWSALAQTHHRRIRSAIEEALAISLAVRATRPGESAVGADLRVLLGMAEAQFPKLIALSVELEAMPVRERPARARELLSELAGTYDSICKALLAQRAAPVVAPARTSIPGAGRASTPAQVLAAYLAEESQRARALAGALGAGAALAEAEAEAEAEGTDLASGRPSAAALATIGNEARKLRDMLSSESVFFRHAVRIAVAVAVASIVGHRIATHPHWVTATTLAVLQPYPGPTSSRAAQRVVGTVLGSALAAVITITIHAPLALALIMFPLSVAAVATRTRSYRLFTFFLTPVFVLIAEHHPGDWWTAAARAGDSVVGGVIALGAALVVWPAWERTRLPDALDRMVASVTEYRDVVLEHVNRRRAAGGAPEIEPLLANARRAAGIAIGEAETSLERWLAEPMRRSIEGEDAMQLVTHARRLTNACTALDSRAAHGLAEDEAVVAAQMRTIAAYAEALGQRKPRFT